MTIAEARTSCKAALGRARAYIQALPRDVLVVAVLLLACSASFALGVQAGQGTVSHENISISEQAKPVNLPAAIPAGGKFVASKNGTKYYPPGCSGASRISPGNLITFASASAASAAGYTLAAVCSNK